MSRPRTSVGKVLGGSLRIPHTVKNTNSRSFDDASAPSDETQKNLARCRSAAWLPSVTLRSKWTETIFNQRGDGGTFCSADATAGRSPASLYQIKFESSCRSLGPRGSSVAVTHRLFNRRRVTASSPTLMSRHGFDAVQKKGQMTSSFQS